MGLATAALITMAAAAAAGVGQQAAAGRSALSKQHQAQNVLDVEKAVVAEKMRKEEAEKDILGQQAKVRASKRSALQGQALGDTTTTSSTSTSTLG